ncbi:MAG: helix-turn-helix transcriptional regulator [Gammaproteobacteria bacterium]
MHESTRSPFVGRARELGALVSSLSGERGSRGRLVALAGEPGMGKTRLLSELAEIAAGRGVRALWSQLPEDPAAPPYFLWKLALRASVQQSTKSELAEDAGSGAPHIAAIVPEFADFLGIEVERPPSDSPGARYQLFDAVTRFLLRSAARQPLAILFDNLHAADRSSLALLEYFAHQLAGSPIAVIGAFRESELTRMHPLRESMAKLSRGAGFMRVSLDGLSREEIAELLQSKVGYRPPSTFVDAVQQRSDGNPLFIIEVGAMLLERNPDELLTRAGFHFRVPDSLSDIIASRLDELPARTTALLRTASVLGRKFDVPAVGALAGRGPEYVRRNLDAAESSGIVRSSIRDEYSFSHALFREVLYAENSNVMRLSLHRKAGEQIEQRYENDKEAHLAELAYHFFEAAAAGQAQKAIRYCARAAEAASGQRAYGEAVTLLECALQVAEFQAEQDDQLRFELLCRIGLACYQSGQLNLAASTLMKASILAYRSNWWTRLADSLFRFQMVCQESGYRHVSSIPLHAEVLAHLPDSDKKLRARMLTSQSRAYRTAGKPELAAEAFSRGIALARSCGDQELLLTCLTKGAWSVGRPPADVRKGLDISREALKLAISLGRPEARLAALVDIIFQLCDLGEIVEVERTLLELRELVECEQQRHFENLVIGFETAVSILRGDWQRAIRTAKEGLHHLPLQGVFGLQGRFGFQMFAIQRAQGLLGTVQNVAERIVSASDAAQLWLPGQILLHCELGQLAQARRVLRQLGDLRQLPRDDLLLVALVFLADAAVALRDKGRCKVLYEMLLPYRHLNATLPGALMLGSVSGYLGTLAATTGKPAEARSMFEKAIAFNEAMHARPALASVQVNFAQMLLATGVESDTAYGRRLLANARRTASELNLRKVLDVADNLIDNKDVGSLTDREIDVLRKVAVGYSNRRIADALNISNSTVATHVRHIFAKTGARNRTEAADFARRNGILD